MAVVEQSDISLVQSGRAASVAIAQWPHGAIAGSVEQVPSIDADDLPLHLAATSHIPRRNRRPRLSEALANDVSGSHPPHRPATDASAWFVGGCESSLRHSRSPRLVRWLSRTFRFETS